jgi:hypothetical protein
MLLSLHNTFAGGRTGHHIIAEIAASILNQTAKENVQKYLGSTSFEEASVWILLLMSIGNLKKQQFNTSGYWFY